VPFKHLVIGGANKCGTTSLFRYLADQPDVCGSSIKEANFFGRPGARDARYEDYLDIFPEDRRDARWLLEGTPTYLDGGAETAVQIKRLLPDAHLVFLLREPVDRLISFFKSKQGLKTAISYGMTLDEFAGRALGFATGSVEPGNRQEEDIGWQVSKGGYAPFVQAYLDVFGAERMSVFFFDDFRTDPAAIVSAICHKIGLDPSYLDRYEFGVENRSRFHRNETLRTLGSQVNRRFEPLLNRVPAVRRALRKTYNQVNTTDRQTLALSAPIAQELDNYFTPRNADLRRLLQSELGIDRFPGWLAAP
jgi:hypothetical protein